MDVSYPSKRGVGVWGGAVCLEESGWGRGGERRRKHNVCDIKCQTKPEKPSHPDVFSISRCLAKNRPCTLPGDPRHFGFDLGSVASSHCQELRLRLPPFALLSGWDFFLSPSKSLHMDGRG